MMVVVVLGAVLAFQFLAQAPQRPRAEARPAPAKAESELKQRARQLLQTAEAEASGLTEAGMRGYALLQLARAYATFDRPKALELLDQAFTAAASLPDDSKSKPRLEQQILDAMAPMSPQHVDDLMSQVPPEVRQGALQALLSYYQRTKQIDKAMEIITRIASESSFPYAAASRLMQALPPESAAERQQLFTAALASFRDEKPAPETPVMGDSDFGEMVMKNWQALPAPLVRDAIDQILKRAESADSGSLELTMFGRDGSLAFNSAYEWRLFQLLPVLRRIDDSAADELLKKNERLKAQFQRFPQGFQSWDADKSRPAVTGTVVTTRDSSSPRTSPPVVPLRVTQMLAMVEQMNRALRDVRDHPHDALAQTLAIADNSTRLRTLILVARATQKSNPTVCKSALDKTVVPVGRLPAVQEQVNLLVDAGRLYLALKENDSVKQVVERGAGIAEELYKTDMDSDDPNKAVKAFWPSTNAWTNFVRLAAQVSSDAALKMINAIPDEEIRPVVRTALAASWLGAPSGTSLIMTETRNGARTTTGRGGEEETQTQTTKR